MKPQDIDFRIWNEREKKFVSNAVLMSYPRLIIDCLGESNTEVICGEYDFVENKNNENILTRFSRFFKQFLQKFQKTRITAPSDFGKNLSRNLTCELIPKDYIAERNVIEIELWSRLYDKRGIKIFDGDIVEWNALVKIDCREYRIGLINYDEFNLKFVIHIFDKETRKHIDTINLNLYDSLSDDLEVIGNIHKNPELIELESAFDCKIRVWDKKAKKLLYMNKNDFDYDESELEFWTKYLDRVTNRKVFHNDIVLAEHHRKKVIGVIKKTTQTTQDFNLMTQKDNLNFSLMTKTDNLLEDFIVIQVLGNIHENPELLGGEE